MSKPRRDWTATMDHRRTALVVLVAVATSSVAPACVAEDPCGAGYQEEPRYHCTALPAAPATDDDAGEAGAEAEAGAEGGDEVEAGDDAATD